MPGRVDFGSRNARAAEVNAAERTVRGTVKGARSPLPSVRPAVAGGQASGASTPSRVDGGGKATVAQAAASAGGGSDEGVGESTPAESRSLEWLADDVVLTLEAVVRAASETSSGSVPGGRSGGRGEGAVEWGRGRGGADDAGGRGGAAGNEGGCKGPGAAGARDEEEARREDPNSSSAAREGDRGPRGEAGG